MIVTASEQRVDVAGQGTGLLGFPRCARLRRRSDWLLPNLTAMENEACIRLLYNAHRSLSHITWGLPEQRVGAVALLGLRNSSTS
jgi:hypothetical protein